MEIDLKQTYEPPVSDFLPRGQTRSALEKLSRTTAILMPRESFYELFRLGKLSDCSLSGIPQDHSSFTNGEQAFGIIPSDRFVYCELSDEKTAQVLEICQANPRQAI